MSQAWYYIRFGFLPYITTDQEKVPVLLDSWRLNCLHVTQWLKNTHTHTEQ